MTAERHGFFDRDVTIKLACCDLWSEAATALGVTHAYRLASATARGAKTALRRMDISDELREKTLKRLEVIAQTTPTIPENWLASGFGSDFYNSLLKTEGIDAGEAGLTLVALKCHVDNRLITGDKKFVKALAQGFPDEWVTLYPHVISFERCLLLICATYGFDAVKDRLVMAKGCDGMLKLALGWDNQADYNVFCEAMNSDLQYFVGGFRRPFR